MLHKAFLSACIAGFFFVFSCISISKNADEATRYETYSTFDLFFTFTYPKIWNIFEKNEVKFSNSVVLLTQPKDAHLFTPNSFLGRLYLSDLQSIQVIHADLIQYSLFLSLSRDGAFAEQEKKEQISIQQLQRLSDIIKGEAYTIVKSSYARAFKKQLSLYARGYTIGETILIVDVLLEKNIASENVTVPKVKIKKVVILATAVRKMKQEIFAVSRSEYHIELLVSINTINKEDPLLIIYNQEHHQVFLQDLVNTMQSIQINTPPKSKNNLKKNKQQKTIKQLFSILSNS